MMKSRILTIMAVLLLAGCGAIDNEEQSNDLVDGALDHGVRVIELGGDFNDVHVYRGETVRLVLRANGALYLSAPDFDAQADGYDEIYLELKAVEEGSFDIIARLGDTEQRAKLVVMAYVQQGRYESVKAAEFEAAMTGRYLLLDVRMQAEYDNGHIDGALLIPHTELEKRIAEIGDHDKVLVYCASGNRSVAASQILINAGVSEVYDLAGGYSAWLSYKGSQ